MARCPCFCPGTSLPLPVLLLLLVNRHDLPQAAALLRSPPRPASFAEGTLQPPEQGESSALTGRGPPRHLTPFLHVAAAAAAIHSAPSPSPSAATRLDESGPFPGHVRSSCNGVLFPLIDCVGSSSRALGAIRPLLLSFCCPIAPLVLPRADRRDCSVASFREILWKEALGKPAPRLHLLRSMIVHGIKKVHRVPASLLSTNKLGHNP